MTRASVVFIYPQQKLTTNPLSLRWRKKGKGREKLLHNLKKIMTRSQWVIVFVIVVAAAFAFGFLSRDFSSGLTAATKGYPKAPSNLTATASSTDVRLYWQDNSSNENGFEIQRKTSTSAFAQIATTTSNITSYLNTNLASSTYTYRVRAFNASGFSAYSNTATTTIY